MKNITNNEMLFVLTLFKNPNREYNASNIAKHMGISPMGALKIAKRLEKENILISKKLGKAVFYRLNTEIEEINLINIKKIHPIYQTKEDFKNNILKNDKIILNAMKGIIVFGEDLIVKLIEK